MEFEILVLESGGQYVGVRATHVREVLRAVALSPSPYSSDSVMGLLNLRGDVVPVIDTRHVLGTGTSTVHPSNHLVVVDCATAVVALYVDRAIELQMVRSDNQEDDEHTPLRESPLVDRLAKTVFGVVPILNTESIPSLDAQNQEFRVMTSTILPETQG